MFELLFYVIDDMSVKSIIKFVVFLASLLKKMYQLFKKCNIFIKFWGNFLIGKFFIYCGALGLGLSCLGLELALLGTAARVGLAVRVLAKGEIVICEWESEIVWVRLKRIAMRGVGCVSWSEIRMSNRNFRAYNIIYMWGYLRNYKLYI